MPYGDTWRLHRRIFHQAMNAEAALSYRPMQCAKARQLVINLADNPRNFSALFHTFVSLLDTCGFIAKTLSDPAMLRQLSWELCMDTTRSRQTTLLLSLLRMVWRQLPRLPIQRQLRYSTYFHFVGTVAQEVTRCSPIRRPSIEITYVDTRFFQS